MSHRTVPIRQTDLDESILPLGTVILTFRFAGNRKLNGNAVWRNFDGRDSHSTRSPGVRITHKVPISKDLRLYSAF
ncbi:MAG: hypothetical protein DWH91_11190 [Planctomycetota bacterium]|nr:MAG: hypothetical protein DWH91_11190 [Planctomycetota bacterium]